MTDPGFRNAIDLPIMSLANDQIVEASPSISIRDAASMLDAEAIGLLLLRDDSGITGVLSERDVVRAVASGADLNGPASGIGSDRTLHWADPNASVADVAMEMMESYVRHVLIAGADKEPVGIVSMRDLLAIIVD